MNLCVFSDIVHHLYNIQSKKNHLFSKYPGQKPVRPNDNEEVDFKGENEDVTESMNPVEGDQIVDQTDQIPDHTDDGQNDPGQHKAGLCLKNNDKYKIIFFGTLPAKKSKL